MRKRRVPWALLVLALSAGALAGQGAAAADAPKPPAALAALAFEKTTLPNGLVLVVNEDHRAPVVGLSLRYRVGSRRDPPGRRGMAGLIRHLMARPTTRHLDDRSRQAIFQTLDAPKWTPNNVGWDLDSTWDEARVPAGALELLLWLESDRMAFLSDGIDADAVRKALEEYQRTVAKTGESVDMNLRHEMSRAVWGDTHPHGGISTGDLQLDDVTPAEIRARYKAFYGPSNAVLALSGDVSASAVKALCLRYFGGIAGAPPSEDPPLPPPALRGEAKVLIEADVEGPRVAFAWPTVGFYEEDDLVLDAVARVLTARLHKRLVDDKGPVTDAVARQVSTRGGSTFWIRLTLRAGKSAADAMAAVDRELADLRAAGPTDDDVRAARLTLLQTSSQDYDDPLHRAYHLAQTERVTGDAGRMALRPAAYFGVTAAAIKRAVTTYLPEGRRVIGKVVPTPGAPRAGRVVRDGSRP